MRPHTKAATYQGQFEITLIREWLWNLRLEFGHPTLELVMVFVSPRFGEHSGLLLSLIKDELQPALIIGCSSTSLIANDIESEEIDGFSIGLFHLPGSEMEATHFNQHQLETIQNPNQWQQQIQIEKPNGWIVFADPFRMNLDAWLSQWNLAYPGIPILGGLATGRPGAMETELYLNDQVFAQGGIGIAIAGDIQVRNVISQGCTPIGDPWIITKVHENLLLEIGNRSAYEVLVETVNQLPKELAAQVQGNLFAGLVINEYHEEFQRGDFLIRNILGVDPKKGLVAVGALPRMGQTIQFQLRSPDAAHEDLITLLHKKARALETELIHGALLCTCNGRGRRLFGKPNHDAGNIRQVFPDLGLVGFFCNGELGPGGEQNFLHGYTASIALFTTVSATVDNASSSK